MIAVEKFGSNFMGALAYNLKKLNHPDESKRAELLASTFSSLSAHMIKKEVELIKSLRPSLSKYVWHTSLNFSTDERPENLSNEKLLEIGLDYMRSMGYDDNQYLVIRHFDAEHPHIHLLANRIRFDGTVVSDSNNYRKSQSVLRRLEEQYNLIPLERANQRNAQYDNHIATASDNNITAELYDTAAVERDKEKADSLSNDLSSHPNNKLSSGRRNKLSQRSLRKNEIERTIRTGVPSDKALLQAILDPIIYNSKLSLNEFIDSCNKAGVSLLFNQASTGRISGITYFVNDFKIKGQSLGNRFKWAEIVKYIDYEQDRDSKVVSAANSRTKERYGELTEAGAYPTTKEQRGRGAGLVSPNAGASLSDYSSVGKENGGSGAGSLETGQDADLLVGDTIDRRHSWLSSGSGINISVDEDDAKYRRKKRRR